MQRLDEFLLDLADLHGRLLALTDAVHQHPVPAALHRIGTFLPIIGGGPEPATPVALFDEVAGAGEGGGRPRGTRRHNSASHSSTVADRLVGVEPALRALCRRRTPPSGASRRPHRRRAVRPPAERSRGYGAASAGDRRSSGWPARAAAHAGHVDVPRPRPEPPHQLAEAGKVVPLRAFTVVATLTSRPAHAAARSPPTARAKLPAAPQPVVRLLQPVQTHLHFVHPQTEAPPLREELPFESSTVRNPRSGRRLVQLPEVADAASLRRR